MSLSLGTLEIGLGLNTAQYDSGIKSAKDQLSSLEDHAQKITRDIEWSLKQSIPKLTIVPSVDHRPLHGLNKHLSEKEKHIDRVSNKTIVPSVDLSKLDDFFEKLESIQDLLSGSLEISLDSSGFESSLDSMAESAQNSLQENLEAFKQNTANFAKFATAPFEAVFTGVFEGIGNVISKKIGKGLESSLKKSTNISLEGIGGFLGDVTSEVLSQIDETAGLSLNVRNVKTTDKNQKNTKRISSAETEDGAKPKKLSKTEQSDAIAKSIQKTAQAIDKITDNAVKFANTVENIESVINLVSSILSNVANDTQSFKPDLANIKNIPRLEPVPVLAERSPSLKSNALNAGKIASEQAISTPRAAQQNAPKLEIAGNYRDLEQNTDAFIEETMSHVRHQSKMYQSVAQALNKTGDKRERLKTLLNKAEKGKRELNSRELAEALEIIKEIRGKAEFLLNDDIVKRAEGRINDLGKNLPEKDKKFGTEFQRIQADIANRKNTAQKAISATEAFVSAPKTDVEKQIFKAISSGQASQNWDKTTASIKENINEITQESQRNSKKIQGGISEASPGPTFNARKNWKKTSDYIKEQIKLIVEESRNASKQIDGNFANPDLKRQLRLERVIESKLKQGQSIPSPVLSELKGIYTRPNLTSQQINDDYLNKLQKAVQIAIRQFGVNSDRTIQLLEKLESARKIAVKQETDKINRIPKTQREINERAELTKKRKEQEKKQQQKIEKEIQREVDGLNRLASSQSASQSPERLAELERKRQAIKDKYEQKRAKEFQDWLKTQKTIGINRNTNWNRQSRISELRQSIGQRRENTNQLIQREVDGLNRLASSQSPERLADIEAKRQAIRDKYEQKRAKEFQDWLKTQNVGINRSTNWNRQSRISELRQSIGQRRENTNQAIQKEIDSLNRISQPFTNKDITEDYLIKIQRATTIAIRKFGANSSRAIQLLEKLESARNVFAKQETDKANRVPKTKQEINEQAELNKKRREQERNQQQKAEKKVQEEIANLNKLATSLSIAQSPERLADIEAKRQAIRDKYEQKRAKEFQDWLKTQNVGINRSTNWNRQSRISELRQSISQRKDNTNQLIQREVDGLNRISSPSFATKEINQDYLNKLQKAVQIAIRQFGANSNRTIELLNKLESARDVFIQQEANKAQKNQRIKSPQEWKSIKEQEKKRQQEAEKRVQEEIEGLRRLGAPDPKAMANIEARRKIILDRRAAREKEARERAELARLKQERQEETSLQGFLNRPLRALNRVRRSTFADAKIETLAQKYADFGTESYFDKFFRNMSNRIKRKISKDPSERETVAREGFGMLFGMTAMSDPLLPALASLAPLALPLLPMALAVSGGINMVSPAFQGASQRIQGVENFNARLNAVTGDPLKSDTEYKYLLGLAEKYRVSLQSLSEGYTQLAVATRGTKLEGEATKELFSAITASIKALRLNTFDAGLVLNAYTQIVAKGKISMEELRQQLGEKFPPTMSVFAKALGVSQSELGQLVAKGSLLSDEVLPKVTKILEQEFGSAAEKGTSDFTSALASMETALFKLDRNFTDIFGGMFAGITNLASGIVTSFSDNFRIISQLAGAFTIGVVAQVGIGLSTILAMPKIAPFVSNIQGFIMGAWKTGLITLTPFMSGILADVIDDVFNTENDLFTNMAKGTTNIIAASIGSLENISYGASGKGFFGYNWEKAVNPIQSIGNTLGNLFKSIPSGVFELAALTVMFEQLIVLGQMFLMPLLSKLWLTFKGMGGAIWAAATNAKSLGGVFDTLFASSAMAKGALVALNIALKTFVALGFMAFARSDFTNPLQASLNESEQKIGASIDNIQNLLNKLEAPTLEVKVKGGDELSSKGLELNLMAMLGDESSSYKTDDAIKEGKGFIPSDNPLIRFHAEHLAKQEIPVKQQEAERFGLEKYLNDYNGFFTLAQDQLLNSARDLSRVNQEVSKALTKQSLMPETVGKSINLLNPFANEAKIIDASIQRLQKERTTAGLANTSESKVRIREIDKEIKRLNDLRKEKIKPLDEFMTDFESLRKGLNSRIEAIDKQDLPEGAKKALRAIVEGNQKIVEETRKSLEEAGFYDILTPLESAWQKATDAIRDFEVQYEKTMRRIENKSLNDQTAVYRSNLNPVQIGEQTRNIEIQTQKERIKQFEANLTKQQQTLEQYLSVPESGRTQEQVDAIEETRKATFEAEKELASARLSLAKSEYDATQDRLRKQQSETKLRVDSEIARKRIDVIRTNPFGGVNASLRNAEIDVEERIQAIGLLYQQLADNTGNPIEIKSQIVAAELALEQARANLLQQQTSLQDYYRNLDRQIVDFNRQIEDYRRQIEDAQLSAFKENRSLSESYSDLVRELDKNLLNAQNQLLDTTDRIRVQQIKNRLLIPGTSDAGKELGDIFLEFVQGQADIASRGRTFQSRTEEIETSYISTLRNIRNLQEQQQEAERNRLRTIEDIKRTQENLNRTLADLIRQTNKELGFIPQSIKDIVTNLNTLPEPIKLINSELVAIPPNIKTSGEDLVKSIEETAEAIRKAKEGLILPAPGNFIPAPVWNGGGFLPPSPAAGNNINFRQTFDGSEFAKTPKNIFTYPVPNGKITGDQGDQHRGVDVFAPVGTPVLNIRAGTIVSAGPGGTVNKEDSNPNKPGYQPQHSIKIKFDIPIVVDGKTLTHAYYTHLTNLDQPFKPGQRIEEGVNLGGVGMAGGAPHLHLGLSETANFRGRSALSNKDTLRVLSSLSSGNIGNPTVGFPKVPFASLIEEAAKQYGIDPLLFAALIKKESGFRQEEKPGRILTSSAGAVGIAQLMPDTAKELGVDPRNVTQNLIGGAEYLAKMLKRFGGNIELALSAYKAGPGNVRNGQLARGTVEDVGIVMQYYREFQRMSRGGQGRTQSELEALRYDDSPTNSGALNRARQLRRNQGGPEFEIIPGVTQQLPPPPPPISQNPINFRQTFNGSEFRNTPSNIFTYPVPSGQIYGDQGDQHRGVDVFAPVGTPVLNVRSGTVISAGPGGTVNKEDSNPNKPGYQPQQSIKIKFDIPIVVDGKTLTHAYYTHLTDLAQPFKPGQRIEEGVKLGGVGMAGGAPHLHLGFSETDDFKGKSALSNKDTLRVLSFLSSGQGGPEFSSPPSITQELPSPPSIAQLPTLPNQNQDNFWESDLPPVPKDNPINFQSPNLPPVPNLPTGNLGAAAGQIRAAEIAEQNSQEFLRRLEEQQNLNNALDRSMKFRRQQEEESRDLNRTIRDASESVTDLTINSKGYLTVQEEINKSATEISRQYRSQIESLEDQRRTLLLNADAQKKYSDTIKEILGEFQRKGITLPPEFVKEMTDSIEVLAKNAELAKEQVAILDQAIEQLGKNQGVATLEASFRRTRDTVRSIRDRLNDLTIQRMKLENQSRPTLFDDSAILTERISLQKDKEELEDYLEPYKDLPQYAEYVANIRSEWEKLAELRLERAELDASPNRGAAESFFSDIREGKGIGSAFGSLGLNVMTKFVEGITKPAIDALTLAIDGFTKPITQAFESVFNAIIGPVGNFFTNALNSIFKPVGNIFSSIFGGGGGGGGGGLFSGLLSGITGIFSGGLGGLGSIGSLGSIGASSFASTPASAFSLGTGFKLFSDGGKVGDANAPIEKNIISAFQRERAMSGGRKPRLIVANEDELVLNPKETEAYLEYRNNAPIKNYANGGFVGGKPNYSTTSNNNNSNQSLVINNTNNVTVESRNDMGYSLTQLKERENAQNERTKKRFFS